MFSQLLAAEAWHGTVPIRVRFPHTSVELLLLLLCSLSSSIERTRQTIGVSPHELKETYLLRGFPQTFLQPPPDALHAPNTPPSIWPSVLLVSSTGPIALVYFHQNGFCVVALQAPFGRHAPTTSLQLAGSVLTMAVGPLQPLLCHSRYGSRCNLF